jgi:hypothetical protein
MQIGLDFFDCSEEHKRMTCDLGVQWTKLSRTLNPVRAETLFETHLEGALAEGLKVVVDLRTSSNEFAQLMREYDAQGATDGWVEATQEVAVMVAGVVKQYKDRIRDWEFWGEYDCPVVSGFQPEKRHGYPSYLKAVADAIHEEDGNARVWNGGYGVVQPGRWQVSSQFIEHICEEGVAPVVDVWNWHPYNHSYLWPLDEAGNDVMTATLEERVAATSAMHTWLFDRARAFITEAGGHGPFAATEWGMLVIPDSEAALQLQNGIGLYKSGVFDNNICGLGETEACAFMDGWLGAMEQAGFLMVNYHYYVDRGVFQDGQVFWGNHVGLSYRSWEFCPKCNGDVYPGKLGAECEHCHQALPDYHPRKATYEALKRWAQKGRAV